MALFAGRRKRKRGAPSSTDGRVRQQSHFCNDPINVKDLNVGNGGLDGVLGLERLIEEMKEAHNCYSQLSALQRLKSRLCSFATADVSGNSKEPTHSLDIAEMVAVLDWLLELYLLPTAKPLRKTLVAVIGAAVTCCDELETRIGRVTEDCAAMAAPVLSGADCDVMVSSDEGSGITIGIAASRGLQAVESYAERICDASHPGSLRHANFLITDTNQNVSTLLGVLELPIMAVHLLRTGSETRSRRFWNVDALLGYLNDAMSSHMKPLLFHASDSSLEETNQALAGEPMDSMDNLSSAVGIESDAGAADPRSLHASETLASIECCGFVLTALIQVLSAPAGRTWTVGNRQPRSTDETRHADAVGTSYEPWYSIVNYCLCLLEGGGTGLVPKDQLTQASLSLVLLLRCMWLADPCTFSGVGSISTTNPLEAAALALKVSATFGLGSNPPIMSGILVDGQKLEDLAEVAERIQRLSPVARLSLLRGITHAVDVPALLADSVHSSTNGQHSLMCGPLFQRIVAGCEEPLPSLQVYAYQILESFTSRLVAVVTDSRNRAPMPMLPHQAIREVVRVIVDLVLRTWENPTKGLSRILPQVFGRVVDLTVYTDFDENHTLQSMETKSTGIASGPWTALLARICRQPAQRKGKYIALTVLVPQIVKARTAINQRAAFETLLELVQKLVPMIVDAISNCRAHSVATGGTQLFAQLLNSLEQHRPGKRLTEKQKQKSRSRRQRANASTTCSEDEIMASQAIEVDAERGRSMWVEPLCSALLSRNRLVRSRATEYLLPEAVKIDPYSASGILGHIRVCHSSECSTESEARASVDLGENNIDINLGESADAEERLLNALVQVVRLARLNGSYGAQDLIKDESLSKSADAVDLLQGFLSISELQVALVHQKDELRLSALETITAHNKTKTFPEPRELELFQRALPYSLHCGSADNRHRLMRLFQRLIIRARDTTRAIENEAVRNFEKKSRDKCQQVTGDDTSSNVDKNSTRVTRVDKCLRWLCSELQRQLYPGAPFARELLTLELLNILAVEIIDKADWSERSGERLRRNKFAAEVDGKNAKIVAEVNLYKMEGTQPQELSSRKIAATQVWSTVRVLNESLWTAPLCRSLLAIFLSTWDRCRVLAKQLLLRFPLPLPGVHLTINSNGSSTDGEGIIADALRLTASPRQTEADAGALVLHLLLETFVMQQGNVVRLVKIESMDMSESSLESCLDDPYHYDAVFLFLQDLCELIELRIASIVPMFNSVRNGAGVGIKENTQLELVNGLLLALKLCCTSCVPCLRNIMAEAHRDSSSSSQAVGRLKRWSDLLERAADAVLSALQAAMLVVADQPPAKQFYSAHSVDDMKSETSSPIDPQDSRIIERRPALHPCYVNPGSAPSTKSGTSKSSNFDGKFGEDAGAAARGGGRELVQDSRFLLFQIAVVGGWQMARDACTCLAAIVKAVPLPNVDDDIKIEPVTNFMNPPSSYLRVSTIAKIGDALLDALHRLKHTGALSAAQVAFQDVCRVLLSPYVSSTKYVPEGTSDSSGLAPSLRQLPCSWTDATLRELMGTDEDAALYVLRRSASFAYSLLSISRAEPSLGIISSSSSSSYYDPSDSTTLDTSNDSSLAKPLAILPFIMKKLLHCATATTMPIKVEKKKSDDNQNIDWRVGVHALNVLRLIFMDAFASNAPVVVEHFPIGVIVAVNGFRHREWAVRNSSTMLFTAILQRTIANRKNKSVHTSSDSVAFLASISTQNLKSNISGGEDGSNSNGSSGAHKQTVALMSGMLDQDDRGATAADFFHRFPALVFFILRELEEATVGASAVGSHPLGIHPSLVPLLLLLSRLRPSTESDSVFIFPATYMAVVTNDGSNPITENATDVTSDSNEGDENEATPRANSDTMAGLQITKLLEQLLSLVLRCRGQRYHTVRAMAARAAAVLCPVETALELASALVRSLSFQGSQPEPSCGDSNRWNDLLPACAQGDTNAAHGTLLLIKELSATGLDYLANKDVDANKDHVSASINTTEETVSFLLNVITSRVLPLISVSLAPPPLRLVALEILTVVCAFRHHLHTVTRWWNAQEDFCTMDKETFLEECPRDNLEFAPPILRGAIRNVLIPSPSSNTSATSSNLERIAAPWLSLFRAKLTRLAVFSACENFSSSPDKSEALLVTLLMSVGHDVRTAAIKSIKKVLNHSFKMILLQPTSKRLMSFLQKNMIDSLPKEDYPPSQRRILRCLCIIGLHGRSISSEESVTILKWLMNLFDYPHRRFVVDAPLFQPAECASSQHGDGDVPAGALELLGWHISALCKTAPKCSPSMIEEHLNLRSCWLARVRRAADANNKVCMRLAAVTSIRTSGFLSAKLELSCPKDKKSTTAQILDAWFIVFGLVLDDDDSVRDSAAETLLVFSQHFTEGGASTLRTSRTCNAKTMEMSMDKLTDRVCAVADSVEGVVYAYTNHLLNLIAQKNTPEESVANLASPEVLERHKDKGDHDRNFDAKSIGNRPIFEPEETNMFLEPILIAQLVARQFIRLQAQGNKHITSTLQECTSRSFSEFLGKSLHSVLADTRAGLPMLSSDDGYSNSRTFRTCFIAAAGLAAGVLPSQRSKEILRKLRLEPHFNKLHPILRQTLESVESGDQGRDFGRNYCFLCSNIMEAGAPVRVSSDEAAASKMEC